MHSRVFNIKLIKKDEGLSFPTELDEMEIFEYMNGKADYCSEMDVRHSAEDVKWAFDKIGSYDEDDVCVFPDQNKVEDLLAHRLNDVKQAAEMITLEGFSNMFDETTYRLEQLLTDSYGFYFYIEGW